ncbi:MAG: hypothetical protein HC899_32735, partial [Leptolyngbyaceae cyanobacterium SM1_4_3]|nr:hypothetical protein [Leptolyngbyaceae cyanobacterium SM1_4_3]
GTRSRVAHRTSRKDFGAAGAGQPQIERIRQSEDFQKLMKLLAGYPLAMEVVLGNLRRQSAAEILAGLDAADVNLDSSTGDKTASILKCMDYSYNHLSSDAQRSLLCLAPFSSFLDRQALSLYLRELQKLISSQVANLKSLSKLSIHLWIGAYFHS